MPAQLLNDIVSTAWLGTITYRLASFCTAQLRLKTESQPQRTMISCQEPLFVPHWHAGSTCQLSRVMCCNQGAALAPGRLRQIMEKGTPCCKARLLHYFAAPANGCDTELQSPANWCGWHTDHGSLTGALLIPSQASRTEALGDASTMVDR